MATGTELQVQEKREVAKKEEATVPARFYLPDTDIYEIADALTVVMEMPGVDKSNLEVSLEENILSIAGTIDFAKYEHLRPIYSEYNIGHYRRKFSLPNRVDRNGIRAEVKDGVLTLTLPKAESAKPRRIAIG